MKSLHSHFFKRNVQESKVNDSVVKVTRVKKGKLYQMGLGHLFYSDESRYMHIIIRFLVTKTLKSAGSKLHIVI